MHLTKEEERIYDGEFGWANQTCMRILVRLGELFGAAKLIPISSAHVSGVSYKTLGDAPSDFLETLASSGTKTKVKTTLNPQSFDASYLRKKLPHELFEKQSNVMKYFQKMGFEPSLTCTPYYLERPKKNSHLAWAESSAVVYANSIEEAWTNREGGPSALAAAVIGKTPNYGIHQIENRQPSAVVKLEKPLLKDLEFGALGILLGKILGEQIPAIRGLGNASADDLKQLGAALASSGMVNMLCFKPVKSDVAEKITVEAKDIKRTIETLTTAQIAKPDLVFLGCPHCSLNELRQIASLIGNRKVRNGMEFWVCTSCYVKNKAKKYVEKIENCGGHVLTDTCAVVTWTDKLGIKSVMTNSAKTAHYAPTLNKAETVFASSADCLNTALQ